MPDDRGAGCVEITARTIFGTDGASSAIRAAMIESPGYVESVEPLEYGYKELEIPASPGGDYRIGPVEHGAQAGVRRHDRDPRVAGDRDEAPAAAVCGRGLRYRNLGRISQTPRPASALGKPMRVSVGRAPAAR